jgi:hypothetical protein
MRTLRVFTHQKVADTHIIIGVGKHIAPIPADFISKMMEKPEFETKQKYNKSQ